MNKSRRTKIIAVFTGMALMLSIYTGVAVSASEEFTKSSINFTSGINCGLSIGNQLDSWPGGSETAWGNPTLTKAYVTEIKNKGFNTVRLPVTWYKTIGAAPDYKVSASYMFRVKTVVNYAYSQGLYVILNAHHEGDWLKPVIYNSDGYTMNTQAYNEMITKYNALWTQIANEFKDYGEKLIFECHNELRDGNNWEGYSEAYESICNINQNFVDTVRATGGNNAKRYLIIKGYAAGASKQILDSFTIPNDPASHLIYSFHSYTPSNFAFPPSTSGSSDVSVFNEADLTAALSKTLARLKTTLIDKGVPVICGEMGTVNKDNTAERIKHVTAFVNMMGQYNIKCIWWENNSFTHSTSSESFGLINRLSPYDWKFGEIADAMIDTANKYVNMTEPTTEQTTIPTTTKPTSTTTKPVLYGDANDDGKVTVLDILTIKKALVGMNIAINTTNADVNFDGKCNLLDMLMIKKHTVNIPLAPWN